MNPIEAVEPHAPKITDKLVSLVKLENEGLTFGAPAPAPAAKKDGKDAKKK